MVSNCFAPNDCNPQAHAFQEAGGGLLTLSTLRMYPFPSTKHSTPVCVVTRRMSTIAANTSACGGFTGPVSSNAHTSGAHSGGKVLRPGNFRDLTPSTMTDHGNATSPGANTPRRASSPSQCEMHILISSIRRISNGSQCKCQTLKLSTRTKPKPFYLTS